MVDREMVTLTLTKIVAMIVCLCLTYVMAHIELNTKHDDQADDFEIGAPLTDEEFNSDVCKTAHDLGYESEESILWDKQDPNSVGDDATLIGRLNAKLTSDQRWPDAQIPYIIFASYTPKQRKIIASALNYYHNQTCIRFVRRTTERDYIRITKTGKGCWSDVGKIGQGQTVSLDDRCILQTIPGLIVHELMHTLGFYHEHQRPDRDDYVSIYFENIEPKNRVYFQKMIVWDPSIIEYPYDYDSVTHYPSNAFAKDPRIRVITRLQGSPFIGNRRALSPMDVEKLNNVYCTWAY